MQPKKNGRFAWLICLIALAVLLLLLWWQGTLTAPDADTSCAHSLFIEGEVLIDPTCEKDGVRLESCSVCGHTVLRKLPATGHNEVPDPALDPTCLVGGHSAGSHCANCGKTLTATEPMAALGHTWEGGVCTVCESAYYTVGLAYRETGGTYTVTGIGEASGVTEIVIPATHEGKAVTAIADNAFSGKTALTRIVIPDGVVSIGAQAFIGCTSLTEAVIPDSVTSLGDRAFYDCTALTSAVLGEGLTKLNTYLFANCEMLTEVRFGSHLTEIGSYAFQGCVRLTDVSFPHGLRNIATYAFVRCGSLTDLTLPASVETVGSNAFRQCTSLATVRLEAGAVPEGWNSEWLTGCFATVVTGHGNITAHPIFDYVVHDGNAYLTAYRGTAETLTVPDTVDGYPVVHIGTVFAKNQTLVGVTLPAGIGAIDAYAFYRCTSLASVALPATLTSVGTGAFEGCTALGEVTLPQTVKTLGDGAFYGCISLARVLGGEGLTSIGAETFSSCESLTWFVIPDGVTTVGYEAFYGCIALEKVVIARSVTKMDFWVFAGCSPTLTVFAEAKSRPSGWHVEWHGDSIPNVLWDGEWHYGDNGSIEPNA